MTQNNEQTKVLTHEAKVLEAGESYVIEDAYGVADLVDKIQGWGIDRNITISGGATALSQIKKLKKEVAELEAGLEANDPKETKDGIGDSLTVLAQIARLSGLSWDECLAHSWEEIKDRKGQMCCGIFVKEADLELPGLIQSLDQCTTAQEVEDAIDLAKEIAAK